MFKDTVLKNRSYRRFYEEKKIAMEQLEALTELGHMTPSGANRQSVRYVLVCSHEGCAAVYESLRWAGYYKDWDGPEVGERPTAYIVLCSPEGANCQHDEGIIGQTILLGAVEEGMGGCIIGNIDRQKLSEVITVPQGYVISLVIALGYPKEEVVIETIGADGDIKYYRDDNGVHHVPKIAIEDIIVGKM